PVACPRGRVRIVDFGSVNPLKRLHRADGTDQLKIGVVAKQVADEIESQGCDAARGHEIANLHPHLSKISIGRREFVLPVFGANYGMMIVSPVICLAGRSAYADDGRLAEMRPISV